LTKVLADRQTLYLLLIAMFRLACSLACLLAVATSLMGCSEDKSNDDDPVGEENSTTADPCTSEAANALSNCPVPNYDSRNGDGECAATQVELDCFIGNQCYETSKADVRALGVNTSTGVYDSANDTQSFKDLCEMFSAHLVASHSCQITC